MNDSGVTLKRREWFSLFMRDYGVYVGLLVLLVISAVVSPQSFNPTDLLNLGKQAAGLGIVSIGQTLVILTGGIDLSVGAVVTFIHVFSVGTILGRAELVIPVSILCICVSVIIGCLNGLGVTKARISPFVMTLCMDLIVRGLYLIYTKGQPKGIVPENLRFIGRGRILSILPVAFLIWILLSGIFIFLLRKTTFGSRLYATGANTKTAYLSGVKTDRVIFLVYTLSGFCSGLAALLLTGDMGAVSLGLGGDFALDSIAAVVIGGTSFVGGIGGVEGTIAGAFIIKLLAALLQKVNISNPGKLIIQGMLILFIVGAYSKRARR
jgi:ribose transport system permease protein